MASGRRTSLASLAGEKVDAVPGQSDPILLTLGLDKLVATRFNPRRNFGTDDDLKTFGLVLKKKQLQPAVVVSRTGYLKLWPEEADNVGEASYVIANGERRFRACAAIGLKTLNVVHDETVAASRADFLDAVLSENNDREDLDPIERALGIETMVVELGGADKVAAHYRKSKGWVSQQRKLLKLTPKLQALVSAGEMPIRVGRDIASLPWAKQVEAWDAELARRALPKAFTRPEARPVVQASPSAADTERPVDTAPQRFTAVNQPEEEPPPLETAPSEPDDRGERFTAVNQNGPSDAAPAARGVGPQRSANDGLAGQEQPTPVPVPADEPAATAVLRTLQVGPPDAVVRLLEEYVPAENLDLVAKLLNNRS